MKTLQYLKKLLNYLLQENKINAQTKIVVEIARELNDTNTRKAIKRYQSDRATLRDGYKKLITEYFNQAGDTNKSISPEMIDRYELWQEQNKSCMYCTHPIECTDVMNGTAQIEHTIPEGQSQCSELFNLTIAHPSCNATKAKRFPTQWKDNYELILHNIKPMYAKYMGYKEKHEATYAGAKKAATKESKDKQVQDRHYYKIHLTYWKKKYETFTIEEVTNQFRRQQLTDTQIITKYALPYLKTVFKKVEPQKGIITADFRKIYKIQERFEGKERTKHSHHAIDAAVLTLIPSASIRDFIRKEYYAAKEKNLPYHNKPKNWDNFHQQYILGIEDEVLNNYQAQHRTLTPTYKTVRKRGEIQFSKETSSDGKWKYKLDTHGKKIPLIAQGDTIRGQLHEESFMTLIKQPEYELRNKKFIPKTDGKGSFIFQQKNGIDELFVVKKLMLIEFDSLDKFKKMIDLNLKDYLTKLITERINAGKSFQAAITEPIWAFGKRIDKNGNKINPLRHIRCRVAKAAGFLSKEKTLDIRKNDFISKFPHKRELLAGNDEMVVCLYYEKDGVRSFRLLSRFELALLKIKTASSLFNNSNYNQIQKGNKKIELPLYHIILSGLKVILLDEKINTIEGLKELNKIEILKRLFVVNNFNIPAGNTIYIYLINHIDSRPKDVLQKNEEKNIDIGKYQAKLALTSDKFMCAIEGKHFDIKPDGEINWKF